MKLKVVILTTFLMILNGPFAHAHHAGTAFDNTLQLTIAGTVKEFKWVNPHIWIIVEVPDENGNPEIWELEGGSISMLGRAGWNAKVLQPGDKVTVVLSPLRNGNPGGEFRQVTKEDGTELNWGMR